MLRVPRLSPAVARTAGLLFPCLSGKNLRPVVRALRSIDFPEKDIKKSPQQAAAAVAAVSACGVGGVFFYSSRMNIFAGQARGVFISRSE